MAGMKKSATSAPKPASSDASLRSHSSTASVISRISDTVVCVGKRAVKLTEKAAAAMKNRRPTFFVVVVISDDPETEPEIVDPQVQDQAELGSEPAGMSTAASLSNHLPHDHPPVSPDHWDNMSQDSHGESGALSWLSDSPVPYISGSWPSNDVSIQVSDHTLASGPLKSTPGSSTMAMSSGSAMSASGPSTSTSGHDLTLHLLHEIFLGHLVQRTCISVFHSDLSTAQHFLELHAIPFSNLNLVQYYHVEAANSLDQTIQAVVLSAVTQMSTESPAHIAAALNIHVSGVQSLPFRLCGELRKYSENLCSVDINHWSSATVAELFHSFEKLQRPALISIAALQRIQIPNKATIEFLRTQITQHIISANCSQIRSLVVPSLSLMSIYLYLTVQMSMMNGRPQSKALIPPWKLYNAFRPGALIMAIVQISMFGFTESSHQTPGTPTPASKIAGPSLSQETLGSFDIIDHSENSHEAPPRKRSKETASGEKGKSSGRQGTGFA
ncbi:hypothetical protein B0H14DRAFT_2598999 [Mycena olivaceomarginata]|nr:hypothetical protein B0H14DRAFT_2598999 [Mycena olivaceomarginata]